MLFRRRHRPELSVIVVVHNMAREAPRTLYSLSAAYQRNIAAEDYEIIVVDNGSTPPFDAGTLANLTGNFRLLRLDPAPPSPARAINRGLAAARGNIIGVMIDGARIATPGLLHFARRGAELYPRSVVVTLGWYLGRDLQRWSMEAGYDQLRENEMLASIEWPKDGYRLFEIGAFDECSVDGWFSQIEESNALFLSRKSWDVLGGVDERFDAPGGGYVNLDTLARAIELPSSELVILLGEATFHQIHGGIATNQNYRSLAHSLSKWEEQYQAIRKRPWRAPAPTNRTYIGSLPEAVLPHLARSIVEPVRGLPLGGSFDRDLWQPMRSPRPADAVCADLVELAESEFRNRRFQASAAVARMARKRSPDEPAPQRLLAVAGAWLRDAGDPTDEQRAHFHLARAKAYGLLGDLPEAEAEFRAALDCDGDLGEARTGLANLQLRRAETAKRVLCSRRGSPDTPRNRRAIMVLGMHRSGTSALAGVINALGVAPPKTLASPNQWNPRGFFESSRIFAAHDELLAAVDSCWDDWRRLDPQEVDAKAGQYRQAIKQLLIDEYGDEPSIFIKDPRICRFVPYILSILADLNVSPVAVLPIRNPLEVALSLKRRDKFPLPKSILMWLRHVLDAEYYSRGLPRYFLSYEGLLRDWRHHVDCMTEKTAISWPNRSERSSAEVDEFLTSALYHEHATPDETDSNPEVSQLARDTYLTLLEIHAQGETEKLRDRLDTLRLKFDEECRASDEPGRQRPSANPGQSDVEPANDRRAEFHLARGKHYRLSGNPKTAEVEFRTALAWNKNCTDAHISLAHLRLPGENYLTWLEKLHNRLRPRLYLEIGVYKGHSLVLARPPTRTIGIDPDPCLEVSLEADTQIYCETSDAFFADARLADRLGQPPDLAFIDGLHRFEQTLRDFMNVEAHCRPESVVLIHDTVPLDEPTQRRARSTSFYTGDVWKTVLCLKHYRPDLEIVTVATPPTGLTIVTGLDGSSRILADRYDEAVKRFMDLSYADVENRLGEELNIVVNDWNAVAARLEARGT